MSPQMNEAACTVCGEVITNPVSPERLEQQMEEWLKDRDPYFLESFRDYSAMIAFPKTKTVDCIICGNSMGLCPHCYTKSVEQLIFDADDEELWEEFQTFFNWNLHEVPVNIG